MSDVLYAGPHAAPQVPLGPPSEHPRPDGHLRRPRGHHHQVGVAPSGRGNSPPSSLVGTTSIGFNLFLGGAMAEGKEMGGAQRGIAFSTGSALAVSVLILIVGAGAGGVSDGSFKIGQLVPVIEEQLGQAGVVVFALGFIAAALSSMLTVPLGAALAADSVFSEEGDQGRAGVLLHLPHLQPAGGGELVPRGQSAHLLQEAGRACQGARGKERR